MRLRAHAILLPGQEVVKASPGRLARPCITKRRMSIELVQNG